MLQVDYGLFFAIFSPDPKPKTSVGYVAPVKTAIALVLRILIFDYEKTHRSIKLASTQR